MAKKRHRKRSPIRLKITRLMKTKLVLLFGAIILAFAFLVIRITYINAKNGDKYSKIVLDQQQYNNRTIAFKRGDILDRNGTVIGTSKRVYNVIFDAAILATYKEEDKKQAIRQSKDALEECFDIDGKVVDEIVKSDNKSPYIKLKKQVSYDDAQKFKELANDKENYKYLASCVWMEDDYIRMYPYGTLASDVIGFTVSGNVGNAGIEASYNQILNGTNGREYGYLDTDSFVERTVKNPVNGKNIVSTIDITLQSIVEKHILAFNEEHKNEARSGEGSENTAVIIMNPNTGEILAEASYPNFDLNNPRDLTKYYSKETLDKLKEEERLELMNKLWKNFCVSDTYEPGSVMKPFTMSAALEDGTLSGGEYYNCPGYRIVAKQKIKCHLDSGHGSQSLSDGIANSCNVVMMDIGASMGAKNFVKYQSVFGFGQKTGIDLPGEAETAGLLYYENNMGPVELATNTFGQGFNVTMTQIVSGFASLINGGNYYKPHVVKQIQDENGNVTENKSPVLLKKTVSEETSRQIRTYMKQTMTTGTGKRAQIEGYSIGAKTGTAEKLPRGNGEYLLSFMGFAPADNPEVLIYVVVDEPNVDDQSLGIYVVELSKKIMEEVFPYLNVTKTE